MSFEQFYSSVISPDLRVIALHWHQRRKRRLLPGWSDLDPAAIKAQLPIVWAYTYDRDADEFFGRIAGGAVHKLFGRQFKGERMSVLQTAFSWPRLFDRAKRVVSEPALFHGCGMVFRHSESDSIGELIIMPLASDGERPDGILGAVEFKVQYRLSLKSAVADEQETWFSLNS